MEREIIATLRKYLETNLNILKEEDVENIKKQIDYLNYCQVAFQDDLK